MDIDTKDQIQAIDLCTPDIIVKTRMLSPVSETNASTLITTIDRFPNLRQKHSILACYPIKSKHEHGHPLLTNLPSHQLTRIELPRRLLNAFQLAFGFISIVFILMVDLVLPSSEQLLIHLPTTEF